MNDTPRKHSRADLQDELAMDNATTRRRAYQRPELKTHDSKTILRAIGPAQGYTGCIPGTPGCAIT